jgi:23S rRNA (guanosine2251-2'-O)-methyltransferase
VADKSFIYGFHAVLSRIRRHPETVHEIYLHETRRDARARELMQEADARRLRVIHVNQERLAGMAPGRHQGVVARVERLALGGSLDEILDGLSEPVLFLVLDGVQDPHNLGACLRVADAFGAHAVIAPKDRAVGLTPVAVKAASGAADTVPYLMVTNLARTLREMKERDIAVIGMDSDALTPLPEARAGSASAWVLGAEGGGLRRLTRETCDLLVRIPMFGSVESLNVSVSAGICLYAARQLRIDAGGLAVQSRGLKRAETAFPERC